MDRLEPAERERLGVQRHPRWVDPMLATLSDESFFTSVDPDRWIYERKLDGVRVLAFREGDNVRLRSRNRKDLTGTYPEIVDALVAQDAADFVVDGEVVAFDGGVTSFSRLQGRLGLTNPASARASGIDVHYYVFDVMHVDGHDTTALPLRRRKALLKELFSFQDPLRFTIHHNGDGREQLDEACRRGWEGLIAKDPEATYRSTRSKKWLKLKCARGQELVIGGFTDPKGARAHFGALLVGYHDEHGRLVYAGKVGTGFDQEMLADLGAQLRRRERETSPFEGKQSHLPRDAHWVTPDLVAEVGFTEWTTAGLLRHPRFLGLRHDKAASEVVREDPSPGERP